MLVQACAFSFSGFSTHFQGHCPQLAIIRIIPAVRSLGQSHEEQHAFTKRHLIQVGRIVQIARRMAWRGTGVVVNRIRVPKNVSPGRSRGYVIVCLAKTPSTSGYLSGMHVQIWLMLASSLSNVKISCLKKIVSL